MEDDDATLFITSRPFDGSGETEVRIRIPSGLSPEDRAGLIVKRVLVTLGGMTEYDCAANEARLNAISVAKRRFCFACGRPYTPKEIDGRRHCHCENDE